MIDKIQKYLLENYPLLWNIRIFPVGLTVILLNLIFFGLGYALTDTTFIKGDYYTDYSDSLGLLYFTSVVISIILFILWLVLYFRNNALKVYYPRRTSHVLLEWLICFIICIGMTFIPHSLSSGTVCKWRTTTSASEAAEALKTIYKAQLLIPNYIQTYTYNQMGSDKPILVPEELKKDIKLDSVNLSKYSFENDNNKIVINGYIGPSLLFYHTDKYYYYLENISDEFSSDKMNEEIKEVKRWLQNGDTLKIKALMNDYMKLIVKHDLKATIDADAWFNRIYKPPFFTIDTSTIILQNINNTSLHWDQKYYATNIDHPEYETINIPTIETSSLSSGYENIVRHAMNNRDYRLMTLVCLTMALGISILIFSCRVTGGKKWLKSLLFVGVFALCASLFTAIIAWGNYGAETIIGSTFVGLWIILFITVLCLLIYKVVGRKEKTSSNVAMTIFLWFIPAILPLLYLQFAILLHDKGKDILDLYFGVETMFWINLIVSSIIMIPVSILVRKWKSLAEE